METTGARLPDPPDPWEGPPEHRLGGVVPAGRLLVETSGLMVALHHAVAHPEGILFELRAAARRTPGRSAREWERTRDLVMAGPNRYPRLSGGGTPAVNEGRLRLGVEFADDTVVTTL